MTAYRIVYVPGMRPKPEPGLHRRTLLEVLFAALSRVRPAAAERLKAEEQRFELVAWTYCFYKAYRDLRIDRPGIERVLAGLGPDEGDLREIDSLSRKLRRWWHLFGDSVPWLTEAIAGEEMRGLLAEVRRYLANEDGIGDEIRELVKMPLLRAWDAGESVMLVGHSLGSVIVYDTLWELSHEDGLAGEVDLLITLGSPLHSQVAARCRSTRLTPLSGEHSQVDQLQRAGRAHGLASSPRPVLRRDRRAGPHGVAGRSQRLV